MSTRVADLIVRGLEAHGVNRIYCVPGESYLALLDALHDSNAVETIVCRHESGAGFMALAEAKLTGRPGVFAVTRGPGATNGSIAIHVAEQDAVPMVMLVGQVSRDERGRGAFQEIDYTQFFGSIAKAVFEVHDPDKMGETLARSFSIAASGVPGPVVISLPEDVLSEMSSRPMPQPYPVHRPAAAAADAEKVLKLLAKSERPLVMAGAMMRGKRGAAALNAFAERHGVPVVACWKHQDVFDNTSPLYAGHVGFGTPPAHKKMLSQADLIVAVGTRLGDIATQNYSLPKLPEPEQPLVHIYPDTTPIGSVFRTDLGIVADPAELLETLTAADTTDSEARRGWAGELKNFIDEFMTFTSPEPEDGVDFGCVVEALARHASEDAIVITDAGNMSSWVHRHWRMTPRNTMIGGVAGAMGLGVPGAVAASLASPDRMAIVVVGDGGTLMTGQEIATAMQYGGKPKIVISNNGTYGTIRTHQEKYFPKRVSGTELTNPDFTAWAKAFGAHTVTINMGDDVDDKVRDALAHDGACVIDVHSSTEALSAFTTLSKLRGD
ncbi:MAG: acetolactate synthase [Rhizobiales bacterium]|nr:acetolactate synthase [Hyphomicrobiales bacterium]